MKLLLNIKYFFISLLFIIFHFKVTAQYWVKYYSDYNSGLFTLKLADIDLLYDSLNNNYTFFGVSHTDVLKQSIYKIDSIGNLIFRNYYQEITSDGQIFRSAASNSFVALDLQPISNLVYKVLYKVDSSYNISWKYVYDVPITVGGGLAITQNGDFVFAGSSHFSNSYVYPYFIKTDSMGIVKKAKSYTNIFSYPHSLINCSDSSFLLISNSWLGQGLIISKLDSNGSTLWSKSYVRPNGAASTILEKPNGHIIVAGSTDTTFQTQYSKLFIMELDSSGNTIWTKAYGDQNMQLVKYYTTSAWDFWPIKINADVNGNIILITSVRIGGSPYHDIEIMKLDSFGNIIWERKYGDPSFSEMGINFLQLPDQSFFVVGIFNHDATHCGYFSMKTDSLGIVGCNDYSEIIPASNLLATDSNLIVTDSIITVNQYIANVDTTTDYPADSIPGCISDGINVQNEIENNVVAYPNPSSGFFKVSLPIDKSEDRNIFIYNVTGKEVYTIPPTHESELEFTLPTKGIYFLKVLSRGKSDVIKLVIM